VTEVARLSLGDFMMNFPIEELLSAEASRWDRRISADLASEVEALLGERHATIPEMRRLLAVKGYREMRLRIEQETVGLQGEEVLRRMAMAMRAFAHERPGLSAATFRNATTDSPEWRREGELLAATALAVFRRAGYDGETGILALRILRVVVRGFVLHEMASSFLDDVDYDATYARTLDVFIRGLDALRE
jgi:hypothetical protein